MPAGNFRKQPGLVGLAKAVSAPEEDDVEKLFWQEAKKSHQSSSLIQVLPLPGVSNQSQFRRNSVAINSKLRMKKVQSELLGMTDLNGLKSR